MLNIAGTVDRLHRIAPEGGHIDAGGIVVGHLSLVFIDHAGPGFDQLLLEPANSHRLLLLFRDEGNPASILRRLHLWQALEEISECRNHSSVSMHHCRSRESRLGVIFGKNHMARVNRGNHN